MATAHDVKNSNELLTDMEPSPPPMVATEVVCSSSNPPVVETEVVCSSTNLPGVSTEVLCSSTNLPGVATEVVCSSSNLPEVAAEVICSSSNLPEVATEVVCSSSNLPEVATEVVCSSFNPPILKQKISKKKPKNPPIKIQPKRIESPFYLLRARICKRRRKKRKVEKYGQKLIKLGALENPKPSLSSFVGYDVEKSTQEVQDGLRSHEKVEYFCSLKRLVNRPPVGRKRIVHLSSDLMDGFRLQPAEKYLPQPEPAIEPEPAVEEPPQSTEKKPPPIKLSLKKSSGKRWGVTSVNKNRKSILKGVRPDPSNEDEERRPRRHCPRKRRNYYRHYQPKEPKPTPAPEPEPKRMIFYNTAETCVSSPREKLETPVRPIRARKPGATSNAKAKKGSTNNTKRVLDIIRRNIAKCNKRY